MITIQISGYLTEFTGGRAEIEMTGSPKTVGQALNLLWTEHVGLRDRVLTEQGEVRPHVNVFVNSETVRRDQVLQTALDGDSEICIMPAVSGGFRSPRVSKGDLAGDRQGKRVIAARTRESEFRGNPFH